MRYIFPLFISIFFILSASCSQGSSSLLLDSFEGEITNRSVDFGASEGSSLVVSADREIKVCGEQSLRIEYELRPSGYMWIARGQGLDVAGADKWLVSAKEIKWSKYSAFSLSMHGNDSGGIIALDIKDAGGELWRFLIDDDKTGWKEVRCPFVDFFPRGDWQPEVARRDGVLDFPIMSFQFEPRILGNQVYHFDCLRLIKLRQ